MKTEISTYEQSAIDFLHATSTTFKAEFVDHGKHFEDDKESRDIYRITLQRGTRKYVFKFGQSIAHSGQWIVKDVNPKLTKTFHDKILAHGWAAKIGSYFNVKPNPDRKAPTAYDVLACLTKYDPGSLADFCSDFGYDVDSIKANKIYKAVCTEWANLCKLFSDSELEALQEIN